MLWWLGAWLYLLHTCCLPSAAKRAYLDMRGCAIRAVVLAIWTTQPLPPRLVTGQRCLLLWHGHVHCQLQTMPPSSQHEMFPGLPGT